MHDCVASCCNPLRKVNLSSNSCNASRNNKKIGTTHVTMCNSPATYVATALPDKMQRKLRSVTGNCNQLERESQRECSRTMELIKYKM